LGEVCSRLVAVGALVASMDILLLFLLVAESLVSFVFGSGDGNKCIDALGGPLILLVEVSIILLVAFDNTIAKELKADQGCLGGGQPCIFGDIYHLPYFPKLWALCQW